MLGDLHTEAFEDFFHDLMCLRHPDFIDVRTHGNIGDQGADGLGLHSGKLYACYAPYTFSASAVRVKFKSDLEKALEKRLGQFGTFVFVHNDLRGMHPEVASMLVDARAAHPGLEFEVMGRRGLWRELMRLRRDDVEHVLGCEIPIEEQVYGIGMEDLAPLLASLKEHRGTADPLMSLAAVSELKLDFNNLRDDVREELLRGMRHTHLVDEYYAGVLDPFEHDDVAAGFRAQYALARQDSPDPDDVLWDLQQYIQGNKLHHPRELRAGMVVLAHFFERCDIFDAPPPGWSPNGMPTGRP
ncbi:ABC-three component system protein [Embleya sp. NPDC050493]|uniref:ABC-three component system protein n=1 Tax=Embleya sp. NPDC050493 TaxID=3363989 RepID=UPI0037AAF6E5